MKAGWLMAGVVTAAVLLTWAAAAGARPEGAGSLPISLSLAAPASFSESCCTRVGSGSWLGPEYARADATPSGVRARLDWSLRIGVQAPAVDAAARRGLTQRWPVVEAGIVMVPQLVGGHERGTIPASYLLTQKPGGAQTELSIALPLHRTVFARVRLLAAGTRSGTRTSASAFSIGGVQAAEWNRAAVEDALERLELEGSLPPTAITLRRKGNGFAGAVRDINGNPVTGLSVRLVRRVAGRWVQAQEARTRAKGDYSTVGRLTAGLYRAEASLSGFSVHSAPRTR